MPISKRNRRGLFGLVLLSGIIVVTPRIVSNLKAIPPPHISKEEAIIAHREKIALEKNRIKEKRVKKSKFFLPIGAFDPNEYLVKDWMNLGLSLKQSEVIVKFSRRGLKSNEDLKKIFVLPNELFDLIKDSTRYETSLSKYHQQEDKVEIKDIKLSIELNAASEEELIKIPGIGPYYAGKIVEYRTKLGGFKEKEQLLEIWKFDLEKYNAIKGFVNVEVATIEKLSINSSSLEELKSHPYIDYYVANSIVKMREQSNGFQNIKEIKKSKLIDEELYSKLEPYIKL